MTACAIESTAQHPEPDDEGTPTTAGCRLTADGAYAARLAPDGGGWFPERWTLDGPEPYAVPLPGERPEGPGTEVQPMGDGRVLIHRPGRAGHAFSLLYPTGPGTGELPLGTVDRPAGGTLRLLPPAPGGDRAYALAAGRDSSTVWLVAGGAFGPERVAEVPGRCSGGGWLDTPGRLLALDRESGGRTKTVVVDLGRGGKVSLLLQIAEDSDDRLLLADASSGLLLISSDAPSPGEPRLGWGVLGSTLPVRFPESLRVPNCTVTPFAVQPGQVLTPEASAVALRVDGPLGTWVGVWRPTGRQVHHLPAPEGWLPGTGRWTGEGELHLPYSTAEVPCGVARLMAPPDEPGGGTRTARGTGGGAGTPRGTGGGGSGVTPLITAGLLTTAGLRSGARPRAGADAGVGAAADVSAAVSGTAGGTAGAGGGLRLRTVTSAVFPVSDADANAGVGTSGGAVGVTDAAGADVVGGADAAAFVPVPGVDVGDAGAVGEADEATGTAGPGGPTGSATGTAAGPGSGAGADAGAGSVTGAATSQGTGLVTVPAVGAMAVPGAGPATDPTAVPVVGEGGVEGFPVPGAARPMPLREAPLGRLVTN